MKYILKKIFICLLLVVCLVGCDETESSIYPDDDENIDSSKAISLNVDFNQIIDPPLLKKVDMYNADVFKSLILEISRS